MYPKTLAGLMMSYTAALPFFRNAAMGDLLFTAAMFSVPVLLPMLAPDRGPLHGRAAS
jgi:hypothetical protein